jgi:predicted amidohydrolase YtcJ
LRCLLLACEELYVRPGLLDVAHIHAFERAQALKTPPAENLAAASAFVKRTLEILKR